MAQQILVSLLQSSGFIDVQRAADICGQSPEVAATTAAASANRAMALLQLACLLLALVAGIAGGALCWSACRWRWVKTNRPSRSRTSAVKLPPSLEKHLEPLRLADVCREYIDRMPPDAIPISSQVKS